MDDDINEVKKELLGSNLDLFKLLVDFITSVRNKMILMHALTIFLLLLILWRVW